MAHSSILCLEEFDGREELGMLGLWSYLDTKNQA